MNNIKVSVIIPIYGVEEYLEECLQSVADQTLEDIQVILMDDGSLDGSTDIAKDFANQYEHFEYHRQVNGGLGNARNNGVPYAKGKYIIFLDSDDVVPDDAYEKMYMAAEENQSDMVVGNVARFDSKGNKVSYLHNIAFRKHLYKTHIKENSDLIYDTTSWNKLIRKEFWDKHNFKFPERILYEDIPVTIPMHYLANNVTMIHDICYRWRIRDGANKSITQRADDFTNLRDRITVMKMVDEFFEKNVTEQELWEEKHYKWLYIDLMVFVNSSIFLSEKSARELQEIIKEYMEETIPVETLEKLPVLYREKFKCLLNLDEKKMMKLRQYEVDNYKNLKIKKKNGSYVGSFPKELISGKDADMTETMRRWNLTQLVESISWKKDKCIIEGYVFLRGLDVPKPDVRKLQAYLFRTDTGEKIPLLTEGIKSDYAKKKFAFKIDNETKQLHFSNYSGSGYRITIDVKKDIIENEIDGEYFILLNYKRDKWEKEAVLRGILKSLRLGLDKKGYFKNHLKLEFESSYRFDLKLKVKNHNIELEERKVEGNQLILSLSEPIDNIYAAWDKHNANQLPAEVQDSKVKLSMNQFPKGKWYLATKRGNQFVPIVREKKECNFTTFGENQMIEEVSSDSKYYISLCEASPVVEKVEQKDALFTFDISKKVENVGIEPEVAQLYVEDSLQETKIILGESKVEKRDDTYVTRIQVDLTNEDVIRDLYAARRQVKIAYKNHENIVSYPVRKKKTALDKKYLTKMRRYRFVLDVKDDGLYFNTLRIKDFLTRSKKKLDFTNRFIYPLLRLLPIKKKWIVFESMWGSKYSCNPRFLYEYINQNHPDYTCIWVLKDECIPIHGNGIRVRRLSFKYIYYMARAKYFVNNVNFYDSFVKRSKQVEVQTMHGTPLKTIGLDVPGDFPTKKSEKNYIRKCKRWDYLIVQSKFVADLAPSAFKFDKTIMDTGYPRTDILYQSNNQEKMSELKEKLGLPSDKKVIMYAPTWRVRNRFELMLNLEKMKEKFSDEYILILRLHHFSAAGWEGAPEDGFVYDLTDYDSIEDLYIITDILITDYSSVMFDYAVLDRPMLFFTYDLESYRDNLRGFNIDIEKEAPGPILYTSEEVIDAIEHMDETVDKAKERVEAFNQKYIQYECANSSEKVFNMMRKS